MIMSIQSINPKTGLEVLPDLNAKKEKPMPATFKENVLPNGQLRVQCGMRIRLSDDDRRLLKDAYKKACAAEEPSTPRTKSNSFISVSTAWNTPVLTKALGMDSMLFSQIVNGRDPIAIGLILRFQSVLGVKLLTKTYLKKVFESYIAHIEKANSEPSQ